MKKVQLLKLAHARSGDKGDASNIGLIARKPEYYPILLEKVTTAAVKRHFGEICRGEVERFEMPNIYALNFLLHEALGGGGTVSLRNDAQGKTMSTALLRMEIEVDDNLIIDNL
ncbi:MAG: AtuA-related protein [Candidatus Kryptoniota bacterium]